MQPLNIEEFKRTGRAMGIISPDTYHALKGELPNCISKSSLADFAANPYRWKYNKDNGIKKTSTGFRWGSLVDTVALTPWLFKEKYHVESKRVAVKKDGTPYATGQQDKEQAAEWAAMAEKGITVIDPTEAARAIECADKITEVLKRSGYVIGDNADTQVGFLFRLSLDVEDANGNMVPCPITCTGMIDLLPQDPAAPIIDLKTTSALVDDARKINRSITDFRYGWQGALYSDMLAGITGEQRDFSLLYVENAEPWCMTWRNLRQETLDVYRRQYREALYNYARAITTGIYPGDVVEAPDYVPAPWEAFPEQ